MKKFNILVDLDRLKDLNNGLGQTALFFGREISRRSDERFRFTLLVPKHFVGYFGDTVEYEVVSMKRQLFPSFCRKYDLWYALHQDSRYFPAARTPYVLTIHDLNFLGEKTPRKAAIRLARIQRKVNRASAITVISKYTGKVVRENLQLSELPVKVIYPGIEVKTFKEATRPAFVPEGDLLFSIGVIRKKKNLEVLIPFIKQLPESYVLVCAGDSNSDYTDFLHKQIAALGLEKRIVMPGRITDEEKCWLYEHCQAVVFPSKFEGMGFPPVEAMRFGKPVFASTFSSIPEISEDKAFYWEHFEPEYMAKVFLESMREFSANPSAPELLYQHSLKFSWSSCVDAYIDLFQEVLHAR